MGIREDSGRVDSMLQGDLRVFADGSLARWQPFLSGFVVEQESPNRSGFNRLHGIITIST